MNGAWKKKKKNAYLGLPFSVPRFSIGKTGVQL